MVYGLGNKGMQLLEREKGIPHRKLDWTARNRTISKYFMEHALAVAEVMVAMQRSCLSRGFQLLRPGFEVQNRTKWKVPLIQNGSREEIGVVPDQIFGFNIGGNQTRWYFLEADRATMPVERNNFKQSSFGRKLVAYFETWRQKILKNSFPRFQVLTVTTSLERVANLVEATKRITLSQGAGIFLFTDASSFTQSQNIFSTPLLNGRGESVLLIH